MATLQKKRVQAKEGQWASVFPPEQVTEQQSTLFVKKLLAVAISSISYLRALFPENAFGDRCLEDISLKILRDDNACPEACQVIQWIRGCFDALEKKYLRAVLVGIYIDPEDADTVIEQYTFKISYNKGVGVDVFRNGSCVASAKSESETKKETIRLLRTIILLSQTFAPLPDDVMMTMKLLYYDEVTPEDYNPPGFKDCEVDGFSFKDSSEPMNIKVGDVNTPFHSFKLRIKTAQHDLEALQDEEANKENKPNDVPADEREAISAKHTITIDDDLDEISQDQSMYDATNMPTKQVPMDDEKAPDLDSQTSSKSKETNRSDQPTPNLRMGTPASSVAEEQQQEEEQPVKCPCGDTDDDGLMVLCASCNTWQHGTCFAILTPDDAPDSHYCVECSSKDSDLVCTDVRLIQCQTNLELQETVLWRRALVAATEENRLLAPTLSKRLSIPLAHATRMLKRLEKEGFVTSGGKAKRFGKVVQKDEIQNRGFRKYFKNIDEEEPVISTDIDMVVEQASNMHIDSERAPLTEKVANESNKRKSEEVVSQKDQSLRFEISNSQDSSQHMKKRRKTSVTTQSMLL